MASPRKDKHQKYSERWNRVAPRTTPQPSFFSKFLLMIKAKLEAGLGHFIFFLGLLGSALISFLFFVWKKTSFSWVFLQIGRIGFYFFFKYASAAGVILWVYATGATPTILAFPLFFYYLLPRRFTRKYFGLSWGSGFFKILIGFTGWLVYFFNAFPVIWVFLWS